MKKNILRLVAILVALSIAPTPAHAANLITLSEPSHHQIDGKFFDDSLANLLAPTGRLGELVYNPPRGNRVWAIDAALVEEAQLMSNGYKLVNGKDGSGKEIAKSWLARLKNSSSFDRITALPYGDPSGYWVHRLTPHDESFYLTAGADHLSKFFGYRVNESTKYSDYKYFQLTPFQTQSFIDAASAIQLTSKYLTLDESDAIHLRNAVLFNKGLDSHWRNLLAKDLAANTDLLLKKIRLAPGKFTISARRQDLPITVINDFASPAKLTLNISELNGRIQAVNKIAVKLNGKARVQVKIPVEVVTSGDSALAVGITDEKGKTLGDYVIYPISIRVISPVATWITYIAAVVLFISALFQSARRIRNRRK
jgi:Family of unknown function (DUF6049)